MGKVVIEEEETENFLPRGGRRLPASSVAQMGEERWKLEHDGSSSSLSEVSPWDHRITEC